MSYIGQFVDTFGFRGEFTPISDLKVAQPYRLVGTTFGSAIDTNFWTAANSGAASAAGVATGFATLTSGTANNGYGQISTVRKARFMFVHPMLARMAVRVTALTKADCARRWGAYTLTATTTPQDGFYFSFSGADVLSVNRVNAGSVTSVASGSFNGSVTSYTMDTNVHAYEIVYFEMGAWFFIDGVLIHKFTPTTAKLAAELSTPLVATSINSGSGTTSGSIELWAGSILRLGRDITAKKYAHITTASTNVLKTGPGTLHALVLNNPGGTLITIYDNTSAASPVVGIVNTPASADPVVLTYNVDFQTGLTIVTTGTWDITVLYE